MWLLIFLLLVEFIPANAQVGSSTFEPMFDAFDLFFDALDDFGVVPHFEEHKTPDKDISFFERDDVKAYAVIFLLLFLVFTNIVEFSNTISFIVTYLMTSFLYNHLFTLFDFGSATGMFEYVFSALFLFVWTDYILSFAWVLKKGTRVLIVMAVTMIGLSFMSFTHIKDLIFVWINWVFTGAGVIIFLLFMSGMRFFTTVSRLAEFSSKIGGLGGDVDDSETQNSNGGNP